MKTVYELDRNLLTYRKVEEPGIVWHDAWEPCFQIYGLAPRGSTGEYRRMPEEDAAAVSGRVAVLARHTAGGRVRFTTDSRYVAVRLSYGTIREGPGNPNMSLAGAMGMDLFLTEGGTCRRAATFAPPWEPWERASGYEAVHRFSPRTMRDLTLYLPIYSEVTQLQIGLESGAAISSSPGYRLPEPVVYYGSSITQGASASRPGNSYPAILSRALGLDQYNLGFSGSAFGEPAMAAYIGGLDMCAFVMDYDYNAAGAETLRATHYPFYQTVRRMRPGIPILCLSRPSAWNGLVDRRRQRIVQETVERARAEGDRQIWFLNGGTYFRGDLWDCCSVDGVHPNDLGHYRMARTILPVLEEMLACRPR